MGGERVYKVYVIAQIRPGESEVLRDLRTTTPSREAALAGWRHLHDMPLSAQHLLLMTHDGRQVVSYRYGARPGEPDSAPRDVEIPE